MTDYKWMVVSMKDHYPSVYLFPDAEGARRKYNALQVEDCDWTDEMVIMSEITSSKGNYRGSEVEWN